MNAYKIPIESAFIVFPFIAFIMTIPFLLHQYRKFGSIPPLKSAIFYSLILYLLCAYFLVILPLPSIEKVEAMRGPTSQLIPFQFVKDIMETTSFDIKSISDFINIFKNSTIYTVLFNIVLTLPFGVYLRYMFKKKWYHTILYTLLLSLIFELTQLSGLYGIYPRPYRLFDVDDLLINTFGGLLGHILTPLLTFYIPTIDEIDEKGYEKGQKVTIIRRIVSLVIDLLFILAFGIITKILLFGTPLSNANWLITIIIYYICIPPFNNGITFGKKFLRLKISSEEQKIRWYHILIRNILLVFIVLYPYIWITQLERIVQPDIINRLWIVIIILQIVNILYYIYTIILRKPHIFLYEYVTGTENISTIYVEKTKKTKQIVENVSSDNCNAE